MTIKIRLSKAVTEWCSHMEARGLEEGTVRSRRSTLGIFRKHAGDVYVENITHRHVDVMFAAEPWAASTRNLKLGQMRTFFQWARSRRYLGRDADPCFGWGSLTVPNTPRQRIPVAEWPRLFEACTYPVETAAVASGLFLFLRGSEQQLLQVKHVHLNDNIIEVYRQKTKEWDEMPISSELEAILRPYLTWYSEQVPIQPEHYLLPPRIVSTQRRDPVTHRILRGTGDINPLKAHAKPHVLVQRVLDRAGYDTAGEGEHTLRRSGARAYFDVLAEAGYDGALRRVQSMLGHKNSIVTEQYLGLDLDKRQRNTDIAGKPMFPGVGVTETGLREVSGG